MEKKTIHIHAHTHIKVNLLSLILFILLPRYIKAAHQYLKYLLPTLKLQCLEFYRVYCRKTFIKGQH